MIEKKFQNHENFMLLKINQYFLKINYFFYYWHWEINFILRDL